MLWYGHTPTVLMTQEIMAAADSIYLKAATPECSDGRSGLYPSASSAIRQLLSPFYANVPARSRVSRPIPMRRAMITFWISPVPPGWTAMMADRW